MDAIWAAGGRCRRSTRGHERGPAPLWPCGTTDPLRYPGGRPRGADALLICTEWQQFRAPDFELIPGIRPSSSMVATSTIRPACTQRGFTYYAIGRGDSLEQAHGLGSNDEVSESPAQPVSSAFTWLGGCAPRATRWSASTNSSTTTTR